MLSNYRRRAPAGTTWDFQFFILHDGRNGMGKYGFSSWTLHMASIIIFSTLWDLGFRQCRGAGAGDAISYACSVAAGGIYGDRRLR